MNSKPRTWSELKNKRERAGSGSLDHTNSFHLVPDTQEIKEPVIRSFKNFQLLRNTYANLCKLPTPMYRDWIACCREFIFKDVVGNTPQENQENHEVSVAFRDFQETYEALMNDSTIDEDVRSQQVQLSLLHLLRTLLSKPNNLSKTILRESISTDLLDKSTL
jgi:hypothetical protein